MAAGDETPADSATGSGGTRQFAQAGLIALCLLALLVAAVATATVGPPRAPTVGDPGNGTVETGGDGSDLGESGDRLPGLLDFLRELLDIGDGSGDEGAGSSTCELSVSPQPTPGRVVTVTVTRGGAPVAGATVRFDGRPVGRTDGDGRVSGRVPYVRTLTVSASLPGRGGCATQSGQAAAAFGGSTATSAAGPNLTRTLSVDGQVRLAVEGRADPGATLAVRASIEDIPMREAAVTANGQRVATTDERGTATVRVPDDGTERLTIRVERGAYAESTTVAVRVLRAWIVPEAPLALPGAPATLRARIGTDPAGDAAVTRDGRRLGTTDASGRLRLALPADPRATLVVRRGDRRATAGVLLLYVGTAAVLAVPLAVLAGAVALAARRGASLGGVGHRLAQVLSRLGRAGGVLAAHLARIALLVAAGLERAIRGLGAVARRLLAGLTRLLRSGLPAILAAVRRRLVALPETIRRGLVRGGSWLRGFPSRARAWLAGATRRNGARGASAAPTQRDTAAPFDLRRAWRALARRVAPSTWRVRTPRQLVALAIERGLPRGPLERLARIFEEVEYGGRPLTAERRERAREAAVGLLGGDDAGAGRDPPGTADNADVGSEER